MLSYSMEGEKKWLKMYIHTQVQETGGIYSAQGYNLRKKGCICDKWVKFLYQDKNNGLQTMIMSLFYS